MDLINLLPDYYQKNETMNTIQEVISEKTDDLDMRLSNTIDQNFVNSSTTALERYEKIFGITPDAEKSNRYRRERIQSKLVSAETTTKSLMEHISESFTNAEVEVIEHFSEYTITIRFIGTSGIPGNIGDIKDTIEEIVPAHLQVLYEYIFNTYGSVGTFTHQDLSAYTHEQIRGGHLKSRIQELQAYQHEELSQLTYEQLEEGDLPNGN